MAILIAVSRFWDVAFIETYAQVCRLMPEENSNSEDLPDSGPKDAREQVSDPVQKPRIMRRLLQGFFLILAIIVIAVWVQRKEIADNYIAEFLAEQGLEVSYNVDEISASQQIISDIVVGDPDRPDLTIERVAVIIEPQWGVPTIKQVRLINPRMFGSYIGGQLSFGVLDPYLFTESDAPFEFPDLNVVIEDGRGLVETDYGPVALKLAGGGNLQSGFSSELAVNAPALAFDGCAIEGSSLYGRVSIDADRPSFSGPLRFSKVSCAKNSVQLADGSVDIEFLVSRGLDEVEGGATLDLGDIHLAGNTIDSISGDSDFSFDDEGISALYTLAAKDVSSGMIGAGLVTVEGAFRAADSFALLSLDGEATATQLQPVPNLHEGLSDAAKSAEGTLLAPILAKINARLSAELDKGSLAGVFNFRHEDGKNSLSLPRLRLKGTSGDTLAELTRGRVGLGGSGVGGPLFAGDFYTSGNGLPNLIGDVILHPNGGMDMSLSMAQYSVDNQRISIPDLTIRQRASGAMAVSGKVIASGAVPGGSVANLALPISGQYSASGDLTMWPGCADFAFDALELSGVSMRKDRLTLCPASGKSSLLAYGSQGFDLAANMAALNITGGLGDTPFQMASGPLALAFSSSQPGVIAAKDAIFTLGSGESETRFNIAEFEADLGDAIAGRFAGMDIGIGAVPLDLGQASGSWSYRDGILHVTDASLMVEDRAEFDRFRPLQARDAQLQLNGSDITAIASLHEPISGSEIARISVAHNLTSGVGFSDIAIDGLNFGENLDPLDLTDLALGVVANVEGVVTGSGRIDWNETDLTSSGTFSTDGIDLAAAFGPVNGASGSLVFTDLLGMTTAPRQKLSIEAINPGIEVYNGELEIQIINGEVILLQAAKWPFMGGTLTMRPLALNFTKEEERAYVLEIEGLEASKFIEHMELNNLGANGVFDGTIPVIFDAQGYGRLQGGRLVSRPPGGVLSYIGDLTYEDMNPMANFAFDALRSLEYRRMVIGMEGPLTGQLATSVNFEGVKQGEGAQQNFITRQIARLPFRFRITVNAPFYQLMTSLQSIYDPSAVRDPRDLGLVDVEGDVLSRQTSFDAAAALELEREEVGASPPVIDSGDELNSEQANEPDIQPPESETMP